MVRLTANKTRPATNQSSQPLSAPEKPRLFPLHARGTSGAGVQESSASQLDEFQPRWWGNVQHQSQ